jgi:hypothetical protein
VSEGSPETVFAKRRQAVIVIHGIGEQRPMNTLRAFVTAVLGVDADANAETNAFYSKPDSFSDSFELRRLTTHESRPRTEFFEFYWAHRMPVASWSRILEWLRVLVFRRRRAVPPKFRGLWWTTWIVIVLVALDLLASILFFAFPALRPSLLSGNAVSWPIGIVLPLAVLQAVILAYVGDAAIYLSPSPRNIETRHSIRSAGVDLLRKLHDCGEYDRIVMVGHSLGSVIGYDILTYAWQYFHDAHGCVDHPKNDALKAAQKAAADLKRGSADAGEAWRQASTALWLERRADRCPWLVTDFVTLGSPLGHGDLLLANSTADFRRRVRERELPTCPPELEKGDVFSFPVHYQTESGDRRTTYVPHHAACFAVTRWTNLYFPNRWFLRGDFVGGPLVPLFGQGVRDVPVATSKRSGWLAHTNYWKRDPRDDDKADAPVARLREALDLRQEFQRKRTQPYRAGHT